MTSSGQFCFSFSSLRTLTGRSSEQPDKRAVVCCLLWVGDRGMGAVSGGARGGGAVVFHSAQVGNRPSSEHAISRDAYLMGSFVASPDGTGRRERY